MRRDKCVFGIRFLPSRSSIHGHCQIYELYCLFMAQRGTLLTDKKTKLAI